MYEKQFGLRKRPFRTRAGGTDVFVGPHSAAMLLGLKKALNRQDAVAIVSGPVGSGKTTIVNRALESVPENPAVVSIARMRLNSDDILELLLSELGVTDIPQGTIRRFTRFRSELRQLDDNGRRLIVVIEDGDRLGAETLAEIEALTAADAGDSEGAAIIAMGDEELTSLLEDKRLKRLRQRVRHSHAIAAMPVAELRGYLRHCFRLVGGDFDSVFESDAVDLLYSLGEGIPRITNNLVESAMTAAADLDLARVPTSLLARVAENEYGLSATQFEPTAVAELPDAPEPAVESAEPGAETWPDELAEADAECTPDALPEVMQTEPEEPQDDDTRPELLDSGEIPQLIQDTLPDIEILTPELPDTLLEPAETPIAAAEDESPAESTADEVPAWERDPTIAELRPDFAALEQAMASIISDEPESGAADDDQQADGDIPELIPEITLDHAISQRIANNLIDEPGEISAPSPDLTAASAAAAEVPAINVPKRPAGKADAEIEKIAVELARAKSLEDVDDKLAETLFGEEINFIASQVLADAAAVTSANDDTEAAEPVPAALPEVSPVVSAGLPNDGAAVEVSPTSPNRLDDGGMDLAASQRLQTVRALNAEVRPSSERAAPPPAVGAVNTAVAPPDPIEDQITSMTQTLQALKITAPEFDDDEDEPRRGFFSRFRR